MKIAFHLYFMTLRGTELATYQFAHYNEKILGNESLIVISDIQRAVPHPQTEALFRNRFPLKTFKGDIYSDEGVANLSTLLKEEEVKAIYTHEVFSGAKWVLPEVQNWIHATFKWCQKRGDVFAATSEWLGRALGTPFVPLIVNPKHSEHNLRDKLSIPRDAIVIGRYGGSGTFDIPFVHHCVEKIVKSDPRYYFLFLNTDTFCAEHERILHLPGTSDPLQKSQFINTCDAMLHARSHGESFGLAIAEFSALNKPVITYARGRDMAHVEQLNSRGLFFKNETELMTLFRFFEPKTDVNWDVYSKKYSPESVMEQFNTVFIKGSGL